MTCRAVPIRPQAISIRKRQVTVVTVNCFTSRTLVDRNSTPTHAQQQVLYFRLSAEQWVCYPFSDLQASPVPRASQGPLFNHFAMILYNCNEEVSIQGVSTTKALTILLMGMNGRNITQASSTPTSLQQAYLRANKKSAPHGSRTRNPRLRLLQAADLGLDADLAGGGWAGQRGLGAGLSDLRAHHRADLLYVCPGQPLTQRDGRQVLEHLRHVLAALRRDQERHEIVVGRETLVFLNANGSNVLEVRLVGEEDPAQRPALVARGLAHSLQPRLEALKRRVVADVVHEESYVRAVEVVVEHAAGERGAAHVPQLQGHRALLRQPHPLQVELDTRGVRVDRAEGVLRVAAA